ncbi:MAG: SpoIID/LytB domain-containing protein [Candidatus Coatesbacteria bacterium]
MAPVRHGRRLPALLPALACLAGCALAPAAARLGHDEQTALDHLRAGDPRGAFTSYRALAKTASSADAARLHAAAAVSAARAGLAVDALAERMEAIHAAPADRWHRLAAARLHLEAGDPQAALVALGEPVTAWDWLTRGQAERRLGHAEDAVASFEKAKALDRSLALADQERGEALAALGRFADSATAYTAALATDASLTHVQARLAAVETALGRTTRAYERYRKLLLVDAGHPVAKRERERLAAAEPRLARAESGRSAERRREWEAFVPPRFDPLPPTPLSPIAVGLVSDLATFRIKCSSACSVSVEGQPCEIVPARAEISGRVDSRLRLTWSGGGATSARSIRLTPDDPAATIALFNLHFEKGFYWSDQETRTYRGVLIVRPRDDTISLINEVPLEEYLLGVVPSEMPENWPAEALKAQAVAARTETLKKLRRHGVDGFDVCSTQHCAVYRGTTGEARQTTAAVRATAGEVLRAASGGYLDCVYAANCGGWGSTPGGVWGSGDDAFAAVCDIPGEDARVWAAVPQDPDLRERFLFERPPAYCNHSTYRASYRWTRAYTEDELAAWVLRRFKLEGLKDVRVGTTTDEGWATSIEIVSATATKTVKRDAIRAALGTVRSNMLTVEHIPPGGGAPGLYVFVGAGWGHGAGLCQDGAWGMAQRGIAYREILAHYYPQARFERLY